MLAIGFTLPFVLPSVPLVVALAAAVAAVHRWQTRAVKRSLRLFTLTSLLLAAFLYGLLGPSADRVDLGPLQVSRADFLLGLEVGARLALVAHVAALGARFVPAARLLPYLTHAGPLAYLASAMIRMVPVLREDGQRLLEAQRARGHRVTAAPGTWVPVLVPLLVVALRRAREQSLALALAGLGGRRDRFLSASTLATVATFAALAMASRLLLVGVPGISPSFFVVFLAGVAYGPRAGFLVGLLQRVGSDAALTGLHPVLVMMAPVEGVLGALAGLLGRTANLGQRARASPLRATLWGTVAGLAYAFVFSVAADTAWWLLARWLFPADVAAPLWLALVGAGLLFNLPALLFNTALFGAATYPTLRGLRLSGVLPDQRIHAPPPRPEAQALRSRA